MYKKGRIFIKNTQALVKNSLLLKTCHHRLGVVYHKSGEKSMRSIVYIICGKATHFLLFILYYFLSGKVTHILENIEK